MPDLVVNSCSVFAAPGNDKSSVNILTSTPCFCSSSDFNVLSLFSLRVVSTRFSFLLAHSLANSNPIPSDAPVIKVVCFIDVDPVCSVFG